MVEQLKSEIIKVKPTPEAWAKMRQREKSTFKVAGMGLIAIAKKFGIKGNPVGYHHTHLELGERIYGKNKK